MPLGLRTNVPAHASRPSQRRLHYDCAKFEINLRRQRLQNRCASWGSGPSEASQQGTLRAASHFLSTTVVARGWVRAAEAVYGSGLNERGWFQLKFQISDLNGPSSTVFTAQIHTTFILYWRQSMSDRRISMNPAPRSKETHRRGVADIPGIWAHLQTCVLSDAHLPSLPARALFRQDEIGRERPSCRAI
jgi:hypothetical protein